MNAENLQGQALLASQLQADVNEFGTICESLAAARQVVREAQNTERQLVAKAANLRKRLVQCVDRGRSVRVFQLNNKRQVVIVTHTDDVGSGDAVVADIEPGFSLPPELQDLKEHTI